MALSGKLKTLQKSSGKSRGISWKDKDVEGLIELMKEETIMFSLENAKTPKEKRAVYKVFKCNCKSKVTFSLWQILHPETSIHFKIYCEFLEIIRLGRK